MVVVGGGNSAVQDALYLSRLAKKVYLVHRRDSLRATKIYQDQLFAADNVELIFDSRIAEILTDEGVVGVGVENIKLGETRSIHVDGIFVSIGRKPSTEFLSGKLSLDPSGYIIADESTRTSVPGVFAVGDVRTKTVRQVVTAVADGASAAHYAEEYLAGIQ